MLVGGATPAFAQSFGGGDGGTLVLIGSIAGGLALGLLVAVLFGPNRGLERDLSGRLGVYADTQEDLGFFGRLPLLRRFARQAETVARDRGVFSMNVDEPGTWNLLGADLPNALVYDLDYDDRGFLWLASEEGIHRFDGQEVVKRSPDDALDVVAINRGPGGRHEHPGREPFHPGH